MHMTLCASTVLIFAKGNHQYEYSASYVTPALSILCIATNGQLLASNTQTASSMSMCLWALLSLNVSIVVYTLQFKIENFTSD